MFRAGLFFLIASTALAVPAGQRVAVDNLRADLRWETATATDNRLDETFRYRKALYPWMFADGAIRLGQTGINLASVEYNAEMQFDIASFAAVTPRLSHSSLFYTGLSQTHVGLTLDLRTPFFDAYEFYASFGWMQRHIRLQGSGVIPTFDGSYAESDFMVLIGNSIKFTDNLAFHLWMATFEGINIFNLHNPYAEAAIAYHYGDFLLHANFRYRILLGFGRRDALTFGIGVSVPLEKLFDGAPSETHGPT